MNITKETDGANVTIFLDGRLDSSTAPQFEEEINAVLGSAEKIEINMEKLAYISSAGLRVLLAAYKSLKGKGELVVSHPNSVVMDVFESTDFVDILTII